MTTKKHLILWVLNILNNESDEKHPLTQTGIAEIISRVYPCDRKTVSRNIGYLKDMGYPIVKTPRGFYLDRKEFSVEEMRLVEDAVRAMPREGIDTERLILKLSLAMRRIGR